MKKILLATTLLAGTAGFAAAEVTLSGDGRMGVVYTEGAANEVAFSTRARVQFNLSGTTDGGLEFGGSFRAHESVGAENGTDGSVFISGAFGKLTMGEVDSAANVAVGQLAGVGYTGLGDLNEIGYLTSGDDQQALYEYSASGFTGYLSLGQPGNASDEYSLAAKYATDMFTVALGYEDNSVNTRVSASASGTFSGVTVMGLYSTIDTAGDPATYGLSAVYTMDALSVTAFYRVAERGVAAGEDVFSGIGASYDLGGGAAVTGGIVNNGITGTASADVGVTFTF